MDIEFKYNNLLNKLNSESPFKPEIALILGSGLGDFANSVDTTKSIPTDSLPDYPQSTVQGHKGFIHFSEHKGKKLLVFQGRIHFYEGYKMYQCILPVLIAKYLGCTSLILTNAAGGINSGFIPSDLMLINSFNAISIKKELTELFGIANPSEKDSLNQFPSKRIVDAIKQAALSDNLNLKEGVYYFNKGPSYETPSEIQMMAKTGNDAVGMSTAHEALYALKLGLEVAGISCITNMAAGISKVKLDHQEVMDTAEIVKDRFEKLIKHTIELL
jgi:purine-nucleoside phosphorylase